MKICSSAPVSLRMELQVFFFSSTKTKIRWPSSQTGLRESPGVAKSKSGLESDQTSLERCVFAQTSPIQPDTAGGEWAKRCVS